MTTDNMARLNDWLALRLSKLTGVPTFHVLNPVRRRVSLDTSATKPCPVNSITVKQIPLGLPINHPTLHHVNLILLWQWLNERHHYIMG